MSAAPDIHPPDTLPPDTLPAAAEPVCDCRQIFAETLYRRMLTP